jgi:hypothetical protein
MKMNIKKDENLNLWFFVITLKEAEFFVWVFYEIPRDNFTFPFRFNNTYETDKAP